MASPFGVVAAVLGVGALFAWSMSSPPASKKKGSTGGGDTTGKKLHNFEIVRNTVVAPIRPLSAYKPGDAVGALFRDIDLKLTFPAIFKVMAVGKDGLDVVFEDMDPTGTPWTGEGSVPINAALHYVAYPRDITGFIPASEISSPSGGGSHIECSDPGDPDTCHSVPGAPEPFYTYDPAGRKPVWPASYAGYTYTDPTEKRLEFGKSSPTAGNPVGDD